MLRMFSKELFNSSIFSRKEILRIESKKMRTVNAGNKVNAAFVGGGNVSSTEYDYLNGVTSVIQTQIDSKAGNATVTAMAIALG